MPDKFPKCQGESIRILYNRRKSTTNCYYKTPNMHGWCGTCIARAGEGERGYCPIGESADDVRKENTIVKLDANWGFCSKLCTDLVGIFPKQLQETKITIMKDKECNIFADEESGLEFTPGMRQFYFKC